MKKFIVENEAGFVGLTTEGLMNLPEKESLYFRAQVNIKRSKERAKEFKKLALFVLTRQLKNSKNDITRSIQPGSKSL